MSRAFCPGAMPIGGLRAHLDAVAAGGEPRRPVLVVDLEDDAGAGVETSRLLSYPAPTVGVATRPVAGAVAAALDVLVTASPQPPSPWVCCDLESGIAAIERAVAGNPVASRMLVDVLRHGDGRTIAAGLLAESTAYSALLSGEEFHRWLRRVGGRLHRSTPDPLLLTEEGCLVRMTLNRPRVRNALDARLRQALAEALRAVARGDERVRVVIDGAGGDFCSGGDLSEFGQASDLALAHLARVDGGPARWLAELQSRVDVRVHGACVGAGVELAAFAGTVRARPGSRFRLPEIGMGLIPGAGGTVSLPRRIGRQRAAWMALTGVDVDAATALAWGLVDEVDLTADRGGRG